MGQALQTDWICTQRIRSRAGMCRLLMFHYLSNSWCNTERLRPTAVTLNRQVGKMCHLEGYLYLGFDELWICQKKTTSCYLSLVSIIPFPNEKSCSIHNNNLRRINGKWQNVDCIWRMIWIIHMDRSLKSAPNRLLIQSSHERIVIFCSNPGTLELI